MRTTILFAVLAVVSAAPAKRCRGPVSDDHTAGGVTTDVPSATGNDDAVVPTTLAEVAAFAKGDETQSWGGGHSANAQHWHHKGDSSATQSTISSIAGDTLIAPSPSITEVSPVPPVPAPTTDTAPIPTTEVQIQPLPTTDVPPAPTTQILPAPTSDTEISPIPTTDVAPVPTNIAKPVVDTVPNSEPTTSAIVDSSVTNEILAPVPTTMSAGDTTSNGNGNAGSGDAADAGGTAAGDGCGLAFNNNSGDKISSLAGSGSKLSWYYNWALDPLGSASGLEFVPMVHGLGSVAGVSASAAKWPSGTKYVLGFNEPDMKGDVGGSDISPSAAATSHQEWVKALGGSYSIGAPAVARGSKKWMDDWVAACNGACQYDFVPFHFYGTNVDELITYAKDFYSAYKKPLWLTEWACHDYGSGKICNEQEVRDFMNTAISWFRGEGASIVERWSYFGAFTDLAGKGDPNGLLGTDGSLNAVGKYYVSL